MEMARMMLVYPTGEASYRDVPTTYPAFNQAVLDGGYMQEMRCVDHDGTEVVFIMDEEGKLKGLDLNLAATGLWYRMGGSPLMPGDVFCGVVAVCGAKGEGLADVPQSVQTVVEQQEPPAP